LKLISFLMLVGVLSALPFFVAAGGRMSEGHDLYIHSSRMIKFDEALRSGVWYPRWLGGMNHGYGAATTLFYPPLFYYLVSLLRLLLGDWQWAIGAVVMLSAAASAVTFFYCSRWFCGASAGALATLVYLVFPYRLIDLYHRAAFPELVSFALIPAVLAAVLVYSATGRVATLVLGALAFALLVVNHPPSAYLTALSLVSYCVVLGFLERSWRPLAGLGAIGILGGGLSSFYSVPAIAELGFCKQYVTESFPYRDAFITDLLAGSKFQVMMGMTALLASVALATYVHIALKRRGSARPGRGVDSGGNRTEVMKNEMVFTAAPIRRRSIALAVVGVLSVLMMTPLAGPLAAGVLPGLEAVAFPWRWLGILGLVNALLCGVAFDRLRQLGLKTAFSKKPIDGGRFLPAVFGVVTLGILISGFISAGFASNLRKPYVASTVFAEADFTPRDSAELSRLPLGRDVEMLSGRPESAARLVDWKPERRKIETASNAPDVLHIYSFMFPGWQATVDGLQVAPRTDPELGTILVDLPGGAHTVDLVFETTPIRRKAEQLSLVTALAALGLVVVGAVRSGWRQRARFD
jgi:hypothetical protein